MSNPYSLLCSTLTRASCLHFPSLEPCSLPFLAQKITVITGKMSPLAPCSVHSVPILPIDSTIQAFHKTRAETHF